MRKITFDAVRAFESGSSYKNTNTEVVGGKMFLFGHEIARKDAQGLSITNAGWNTATTKERLNAIPGVHIIQKAGIWYLNGYAWGGQWVTVAQWNKQKIY